MLNSKNTHLHGDQIMSTNTKMGRPANPDKEVAILEAARGAFLELPFERVSMDAIAARAEVSKVTVYAKYKSKEALFLAAMNEGCDMIYGQAKLDAQTGGSLEQILSQLGTNFMLMIVSPDCAAMHGVMMQVANQKPELPRQFYETIVSASIRTLAETLVIAHQRGDINCADTHRAAIQFIAMVQGNYLYQLQLGVATSIDPDELASYVRDCVTLFMRGYRVEVN
jgi:TetR/AcrR family transcriptional regulator, mexJK operon transcriptional repressor